MSEYKTPGVYIEEISQFPPSIAPVETAIPAFIGYTEKAQQTQMGDLTLVPTRIESLLQYELYFGGAQFENSIEVTLNGMPEEGIISSAVITNPSPYLMYYSMQLYFTNGGGSCYIVSVGEYNNDDPIDKAALSAGLNSVKTIDEVTLIVFPDAIHLPSADFYYSLHKEALQQCADRGDRFTIMDVWIDNDNAVDNIQTLRNSDLGTVNELKYGAAYYPLLNATIGYRYEESDVIINAPDNPSLAGTLADLETKNNACYVQAIDVIKNIPITLPVAPAVAGVYACIDNTRGVWKAPANININEVSGPVKILNNEEQTQLNVDAVTGKSINVIRSFEGRGNAIVWGARTLAGNDNEWKYISVRRFFNMVEESVKKGTETFVFEPNDNNTWIRIKGMIYNYLILQWRAGALMGATAKDAFYVAVGLGETMTAQDILEGRLIVEVGMAVVRPAEFIILRFTQNMVQS